MSLVFGFSTVADGNMSVKWGEEGEVIESRKRWLKGLKIDYTDCVFASLLGGADVNIVSYKDKGKLIEGDALITRDKNTALFMVTADCLPVIIYSDEILALVHLGWRGVDLKLVQKVLFKLQESGFKIEKMKMLIGPGTKKETYVKYGEKLNEFYRLLKTDMDEWKSFLKTNTEGRTEVDLVGFVIKQAADLGFNRENIEISEIDTIKNTNYFSHYRAGTTGEKEGRFATVACIRSSD